MRHIEDTIRAVIRLLKENVLDNVVQATHADYGEIAQLPVLILHFPRIAQVPTEAGNERVVQKDLEAGRFSIAPPPRFYDLEFDYELVTATLPGPSGLTQLSQKCLHFFAEHSTITVDRLDEQGNIYAADTYELEPTVELGPGAVSATYFTARGSFAVRRVRVDDRRRISEGALIREFNVEYSDETKDAREIYRHL